MRASWEYSTPIGDAATRNAAATPQAALRVSSRASPNATGTARTPKTADSDRSASSESPNSPIQKWSSS